MSDIKDNPALHRYELAVDGSTAIVTYSRVGDVLTLGLHGRVRVWRVLALASRRGPPAEARSLYEDLSEGAT